MPIRALLGPLLACVLPAAAAQDPYPREYMGSPGATRTLPSGRRVYVGHYGYAVEVPAGYAVVEGLSDPEQGVEHALLQASADPDEILRSAMGPDFAARGGAILEVRRRARGPAGPATLADVREDYAASARSSGMRLSFENNLRGYPLPAMGVRYDNGKREIFLQGKYVFYRLATSKPAPAFEAVLRSLREVEPSERMRGFIRTRREPDGSGLYFHIEGNVPVPVLPGLRRAEPRLNRGVYYDLAWRSDKDRFECRIQYRPMAGYSRQYAEYLKSDCRRKGTCRMVDPDAPQDGYLRAISFNAAAGREEPAEAICSAYPPELIKAETGGDWGFQCGPFPISPSSPFGEGYAIGSATLIHENGIAEYAYVFLGSDPETVKRNLGKCMVLRFENFYRRKAAGP